MVCVEEPRRKDEAERVHRGNRMDERERSRSGSRGGVR